ncbi:nucleotidyltransferase family protein [Dongia sp.]|uniref:nucleotidyltransferase family protein n=1 Tax=Dongia sp. TaxID=1977262 RepID=UPI0035B4B7D4
MRALLLAAGLGTRLRPITEAIPKCLVPIRGQPLLDYWLVNLAGAGVEEILINTGYLSDLVRAHVRRSPWANRITLVHEDRLLGTGGTVLANRAFFGEESFLVIHADNLSAIDLDAFRQAHRGRKPDTDMTMALFRTDQPSNCGIVQLDSEGRVVEFHEKMADPPGNLANGAVYIFEPEVFRRLARVGKPTIDLSTEIIPGYVGRIQSYEITGYHRDIGTVEGLTRAEREYQPLRCRDASPDRNSEIQ